MRRPGIALAGLLAAAACTGAPGARVDGTTRQYCFWASQVTGFGDAGPDRALVHIGARETWELSLSPGCPDVNWAMRIGIRAHGGERICAGRPAELLVPETGGSASLRRCLVREVRMLSGEDAAIARGTRTQP